MRPSLFVSLALLAAVLASPIHAQGRAAAPLAPQQDSNWLASASAEMSRAEYRFNPVRDEPEVWSAPNRAHEFRTRVSARGLEVFPRTTSADGQGAPWKLHLRTTHFGRTDGSFELPPPTVTATGERIELDHGYAIEWLENTSQGLKQGWTIPARPLGTGDLWIGLEITGDLSFRIDEGGRSGLFVDACGTPVLRYRDLVVFDATSRELPARLTLSPLGLGLTIDDFGASYPLTVDPLLTDPAWTAESDQAGAQLGISVSTAGDVNGDGFSDVIVGSRLYDNGQADEGRALLYLGSAAGLSAIPDWTAESDQTDGQFGISVATAGDVNGDGFGDAVVAGGGGAFLFVGTSAGLASSASWTAVDVQSAATAGDVNGDGFSDVIVGAPSFSTSSAFAGRALVYLGSATGLATSAAWTADGNQVLEYFGWAVSTAGDVNGDGYSDVIIGAFNFSNDQQYEGGAFLFLGSSAGLSATSAWAAESDQSRSLFGYSLSTAGDVNGDGYSDVLVGAYAYDSGLPYEGRVFLYLGSATGLSTSSAWTGDGDQDSSLYGLSVATAGDVNGDGFSDVLVGSPNYDNGQTNEGRAFLYLGSSTGLPASPAWTVESDQELAIFGLSVGGAGDVNGDGFSDVVVGSPNYDNDQTDEGRAYVFLGSPSGLSLTLTPTWSTESNEEGARIGASVSTAGDVNGDGFCDVIIGAPFAGGALEGRAYLHLGSASGLPAAPSWVAESSMFVANFGMSVSTAGDVNGDGFCDVIIGAPGYSNGEGGEGGAYLFFGSSQGLAQDPAWVAESNMPGSQFGQSVSTAGDVNGDGYSDVVIGAPSYSNGESQEGCVYVYLGSPNGLATTPGWRIESNQLAANLGASVAAAGDVNGDGYSDVVLGAPGYDDDQVDEGRAYVYLGSPMGLELASAWMVESDQSESSFASSVATAGDVNGDGYSDVIVGARSYDNDQPNEGRAYLFLGRSTGLALSPAWTAESNLLGFGFASAVASAQDVNSDGYSDIIVGSGGNLGDGFYMRASVYHGSASGLAPSAEWTLAFVNLFDASVAVSSAGDLNGDGFSDIIIGEQGFGNHQTLEGRAFVHLGNQGFGSLVRGIQQRAKGGNRPLAVVGAVGRDGLFRIRCEFPRSAAGVEWASPAMPEAWLEWEVKPLGSAFDGTDVQMGTPQALVPGGGTLTFDELASIPDTISGHARLAPQSHHWRARVATNNPLFPNTAWFSVQGSNITEAKVRKTWR